MYSLVADYHTHTRYSHGRGSILDNVEAARNKGLKIIAITDHGFNHIGFGISISSLKKMKKEIESLNRCFSDIKVLLGIEANLIGLDGKIDIPVPYLDAFDIILMGFHRFVKPAGWQDFKNLFLKNGLDKLGLVNKSRTRQINTLAVVKAIERYPIRILAHPGANIDFDSRIIAQAAAENNVALEINASHGFMTDEYVRIALDEGADFVVNSDAHTPKRIGDFKKGMDIAIAAGVPSHRIINTEEYIHRTGA
ncbi:MAG TPA: histidinol-phosphatase [Clostridiales bacterium]|nr:PHP domain-containing protein [Clostridia bacterium]HCS75123.1 histidinol-phosphatase [Clostridiales bacterium]